MTISMISPISPTYLPDLFPVNVPPRKTALILGTNGYIGAACAHAFARASYQTLGVIRTAKSSASLSQHGVTPMIGSAAELHPCIASVVAHTRTLNVIVVASEQWPDYVSHFKDTMALLTALAKLSNSAGVRPLVIFSSGCKDYGSGELDASPGLKPHTEKSPLNPPGPLALRTEYAPKVFEYEELFDAVVTRPTNVHGYSSSYYAKFIEMAIAAKKQGAKLVLPGDSRVIAHSVNVDDCGEAYVAIAECPERREVAGEVFNISAKRYETLGQIAEALQRTFGLEKVECIAPPPDKQSMASMLFEWSQWVGSEKLRSLTGWKDVRPLFGEGIEQYKTEYEEANKEGDENVARVLARFGDSVQTLVPAQPG